MAAYRESVYDARVIVMSFVAAYRDRVNGARVIVMSFVRQVTG